MQPTGKGAPIRTAPFTTLFLPTETLAATENIKLINSDNNLAVEVADIPASTLSCSTAITISPDPNSPLQEEISALTRLTFNYKEMAERYHSHLREAAMEAAALREENAMLREANADLSLRLSMLLSFSTKVNSLWRQGYLASMEQRVRVTSGEEEDTEVEVEAFKQGMFKIELCNKWHQSGKSPYSDHCQFAHGSEKLRPVIRHPRYKTELCRMVVAGDAYPYGHRCHFRHVLTEEEKLSAARLQ